MTKPDASDLNELLAKLVAFQTVSGNTAAASECADYTGNYLEERGMHVKRHLFNGFPTLVATSQKTTKPKILLQAHLDVVPCRPDLFTLQQHNGKLLGRGVYDMKFAGAVFLKLADELKEELADYDFGIMFSFDEEIGGENGVGALLKEGYRAEVCILPDAGDNWHIEKTQKGAWIVRLETKGIAVHGSRPWEGDNAIHRLLTALEEIREMFIDQHVGSDSLSINMMAGGNAINQVADKAEATLDMRFVSTDNYQQMQNIIHQLSSKYNIATNTVVCIMPVKTDFEHPMVASFLKVAETVHGSPLLSIISLGTSDSHFFADLNIPTILLRPDGGAPHSDTEWMDAGSFAKYYQLIKSYIESEARV